MTPHADQEVVKAQLMMHSQFDDLNRSRPGGPAGFNPFADPGSAGLTHAGGNTSEGGRGSGATDIPPAYLPLRNQINYQRTREMTIDELLLENRVVFLIGEISYASAARAIMQMLYLDNQKKGQDINLYINSHGGTVDDTLALYDTIQFLDADVATYCIGRAYSGASLILAAGAPKKRYILPNAKVMIHQPLGGVYGQAEDIKIQAEQIIKTKRKLAGILAEHTGRELDVVLRDSERDRYFTAEEAQTYGIVDTVLEMQGKKKRETASSEEDKEKDKDKGDGEKK